MIKGFLGKGWKFPIFPDAAGFMKLSEYEEDIRESIILILSTSKGERVMRPDFGSGIYNYTFETINTTTIGLFESSIRDALQKWEPRIVVSAVNVSLEEVSNGKLLIDIAYTVKNTNNQFNLVYPFYLSEG